MTSEAQSRADEYNYMTSTSEARGKIRVFAGINHAGDQVPEFEVHTAKGNIVRLSDYRDTKHVLLEFDAITGPPFVGEVSPLNRLYERFRDKDVEFLTVYVREPHPGENYHEHRTWERRSSMPATARSRRALRPS